MKQLQTWVFTIKDPVAMAGFPIPPLAVGQGTNKQMATQAALKELSRLADLNSVPADDGEPMWANQGRLSLKAAMEGDERFSWALQVYEIEPIGSTEGYVNAPTQQVGHALMTHDGLRNSLQSLFRFLAVEDKHVLGANKAPTGAQSVNAWIELYRRIRTIVPLPVRNELSQYAWMPTSAQAKPEPLVHQIDWVAVLEDVMGADFPMTREQSLRACPHQAENGMSDVAADVVGDAQRPEVFPVFCAPDDDPASSEPMPMC